MRLRNEIIAKLGEKRVEDITRQLVVASLSGMEEIEAALEGKPIDIQSAPEEDGESASSIYLHSISVTGFRGIGPECTLELAPGPGLTVVTGRNGSGKSSFFEALEVLLTNQSYRWQEKPVQWRSGWRNLHHRTGARVTALFQVEGVAGSTVVEKQWPDDAKEASGSRTTAQHHGRKLSDLEGIGWTKPIRLFRPLLSHPELGMIESKPSHLFDSLSEVLGLEELNAAGRVLIAIQKEKSKPVMEAKRFLSVALEDLDSEIQDSGDPLRENPWVRAALEALETVRAGLSDHIWDLSGVERLLNSEEEPSMQGLRELAVLNVPTEEEVLRTVSRVEEALQELDNATRAGLDRSEAIVALLEKALDLHRHHPGKRCPVCRRRSLGRRWRRSAKERAEELRSEAQRYRAAQTELEESLQEARHLTQPPQWPESPSIDISILQKSWNRWNAIPESDPSLVSQHLLDLWEPVESTAEVVKSTARERYSQDSEWWDDTNTLLRLMARKGERAAVADAHRTAVQKAEIALQNVSLQLRSERWAPIENQALELWRSLRLNSNLELGTVELSGVKTRRRVSLEVTVDGAETSGGLGVASQGEINCLALSLFFPRGTLPESPFRFLVIDDPIQAMDPARVDALAQVFTQIASDRQVVIFTHDDRLPEALRRLDLPHRVLEVTRQPGSVVTVRDVLGPIRQNLDDARAVAREAEEEKLSQHIANLVVPTFCRQALEAACVESVRRNRLERGEPHTEVEQKIFRAGTLRQKVALALLGDSAHGNRVNHEVIRRWPKRGRDWAAALRICNEGAHSGGYRGDLRRLIKDCQQLAERIRK